MSTAAEVIDKLDRPAQESAPVVSHKPAFSWPIFRVVLLLWLATRLGYALVSWLVADLHLANVQPPFSGLIMGWERWDSNWYLLISRRGYYEPQATNFFPLFPMAISGISWVLGDGSALPYPHPDRLRFLVGLGLSNMALLAGLYALSRLAELERETREVGAGVAAVRAALAYPLALVWGLAYAEGFFFALAAMSLLFARQRRWPLAAGAAFLAGLTRPVALILVLPLAWEFSRQHRWWQPWSTRLAVTCALVAGSAPAAMMLYFAYVYRRFHDFLLPVHSQFLYWHHVSMAPWQALNLSLDRIIHHSPQINLLPLEVTLFLLYAVLTVFCLRRLPFMHTLYMAGLLGLALIAPVPSASDPLWGTTRYLAGAIPIYLLAAAHFTRRPWLDQFVTSAGFLLQGAMIVALLQNLPIL
jgi:hypothetical protein